MDWAWLLKDHTTLSVSNASDLFGQAGSLASFLMIWVAEFAMMMSCPCPESNRDNKCDSLSEPSLTYFVKMDEKVCKNDGLVLHNPWSNAMAANRWFFPESNSGWSKSCAKEAATF